MTRPDEIKQNFMGHVVKNLLEYFTLLLADFQNRLPHEIERNFMGASRLATTIAQQ